MSRYYFHIRGGPIESEDEEGLDLPDLGAARQQAIVGVRGIIAAEVLEGRLTLSERVDIEDGEGRHVLTIAFADAIDRSA